MALTNFKLLVCLLILTDIRQMNPSEAENLPWNWACDKSRRRPAGRRVFPCGRGGSSGNLRPIIAAFSAIETDLSRQFGPNA
jgi:hypothetical protein